MLIIRPEAICNSSSADYDCAIVFLPLISSAAPVLQKTVIHQHQKPCAILLKGPDHIVSKPVTTERLANRREKFNRMHHP